jgi:hypothetical protein
MKVTLSIEDKEIKTSHFIILELDTFLYVDAKEKITALERDLLNLDREVRQERLKATANISQSKR